MKKGLLSILALAVTIVGCQNYDDQFDALNTQITALKSQVDGLAAVQSAVTALQGQLASLSSAALTSADLDTALSAGLADIIADVEAVQSAVADVASAADVTAVSDALTDAQTDLDELLAQSSVFTGDVNVTSESTLDAFLAMGSSLNIVNGNVTITPTAGMDQARVQELVDNIITVIKDFTYTAPSSDYAQTTFTALTGVQTLTLKQGGGYDVRNLTSAANIYLNNAFKSTVTLIHLGALTTVTTIQDDDGTAGTISFNKVEEFHLTSLARYPGNNLNVTIKEGGVLDISSLTDQDADGDAIGAGYSLTVDGPASMTLSNISDGTISMTNVNTVNISGFIGNSDINAGVLNLTIDGAVDLDISGAADLETANITGALDSATGSTDTTGPAITFASQDLISATVAGIVGAVNATNQSNLETLTVSADMKGAALTVSGNGDLVTLTVTGAKIGNVTVDDNDDLESVTLDHTTALATGDKAAALVITDNNNLESATYSADKVDTLTITGNVQLETIDFTGLATVGTATSVTIDVKNNKLTASLAKDAYQAAAAADAGSYTSASGMVTLKTYLTAANAVATKDIEVYFDVIEQVQTQASATANYVDAAHTDSTSDATEENAVLVSTTTPASGTTVRETESFVWEGGVNALRGYENLGSGEGVSVTYGGVTKTWVEGGTPAYVTVDDLITAINADTTFGSGITITAARDSWAKSYNKISYTDDGGAAETTASTGSILWSLGSVTGTANIGTGSDSDDIASVLAAAITGTVVSGVKYGAESTGSEVVLTRVVTNTTNTERGVNTADFPDIAIVTGNTTFTTVDLSSNVSTTNVTGLNSDYFISVTQTNRNGLRVTVKNNSTSVALSATVTAVSPGTALVGGTPTELVSGTNMPANTTYDAGFSEISNATPSSTTTTSRLAWLG